MCIISEKRLKKSLCVILIYILFCLIFINLLDHQLQPSPTPPPPHLQKRNNQAATG